MIVTTVMSEIDILLKMQSMESIINFKAVYLGENGNVDVEWTNFVCGFHQLNNWGCYINRNIFGVCF